MTKKKGKYVVPDLKDFRFQIVVHINTSKYSNMNKPEQYGKKYLERYISRLALCKFIELQ